jgi:anti-anti-sigma factor
MISVSTDHDGAVVTVAVAGEIDLATGPVMRDAIDHALTVNGADSVRVDLSGVRFMDSSGIAVLLQARRAADELARAFQVVGAQGLALQVLELTGVWDHLSAPISPDRPNQP